MLEHHYDDNKKKKNVVEGMSKHFMYHRMTLGQPVGEYAEAIGNVLEQLEKMFLRVCS